MWGKSQTSNTLASDLMDVYTQLFSLVPLFRKYMCVTDPVVWLMVFVLMTAIMLHYGTDTEESACVKGIVQDFWKHFKIDNYAVTTHHSGFFCCFPQCSMSCGMVWFCNRQ